MIVLPLCILPLPLLSLYLSFFPVTFLCLSSLRFAVSLWFFDISISIAVDLLCNVFKERNIVLSGARKRKG